MACHLWPCYPHTFPIYSIHTWLSQTLVTFLFWFVLSEELSFSWWLVDFLSGRLKEQRRCAEGAGEEAGIGSWESNQDVGTSSQGCFIRFHTAAMKKQPIRVDSPFFLPFPFNCIHYYVLLEKSFSNCRLQVLFRAYPRLPSLLSVEKWAISFWAKMVEIYNLSLKKKKSGIAAKYPMLHF